MRSYNSTLVEARKLILSMYLHLVIICNIYKYCHEFLESVEVDSVNSISQLWIISGS